MPNTLAIDYGARYVGIALVSHANPRHNTVLYAATLVIEPKPLNALSDVRAQVRRMRRSRKTHRRRLERLAQSLQGVPNLDAILRFCRRRGFSHEAEDTSTSFQFPRSTFFEALRQHITDAVPAEFQARVTDACSKHLNESCRREAELRPARFENRGPSRCQWEGCTKNVPRAENDFAGRIRQPLVSWMLPVFASSPDRERLLKSVNHWVGLLNGYATAFRKVDGDEERKRINTGIKKVYKQLLARVTREAPGEVAEKFQEDWKETYRKVLSDVIRGVQTGRTRFCREHSLEFVDHLLNGKVPSTRVDIQARDLVSRKQQIVFQRLWRLVEARLLPLAGGRIDRVVVERVAFDVLAGPFKARMEVSPSKANQMYLEGPMLGFDNRLDMLKTEFNNRCAYCGELGITEQVEHLLPRSVFPFDSYFNVLPSCTACNNKKGARTALEAGMTVHLDAYQAYSDYVRKKTPQHIYHTTKKGLLNLLCRKATSDEAQRRLAMLANDLVTVTATQRSPRPLARYLATALQKGTGTRPEIAYRAGRHTALYRSAAFPDYSKAEFKEEGDLRNHALDAILLACDFPSVTALENKHWKLASQDVEGWFEQVRRAAPAAVEGLGLPRIAPVSAVPYFEEDLGGGYFQIDLAAFNWNRKRKGSHQLDPFGQTKDGKPLKRVPAASLLAILLDKAKRAAQVELIAHRGLRDYLRANLEECPEKFVGWLQKTTQSGLMQNGMSLNPADAARKQLLERFVNAAIEQVLEGEEAIPPVIGVRCINKGSESKLEVRRSDAKGSVFQYYQAQPVYREWYVGYRDENRAKPFVFTVSQGFAVRDRKGVFPANLPDDSPLRGRPHGSRELFKEFMGRWRSALRVLFQQERLTQVFRLAQGCVIEKADGMRFQLRNFDKSEPWMRPEALRDIMKVHRSPLRVMRDG